MKVGHCQGVTLKSLRLVWGFFFAKKIAEEQRLAFSKSKNQIRSGGLQVKGSEEL